MDLVINYVRVTRHKKKRINFFQMEEKWQCFTRRSLQYLNEYLGCISGEREHATTCGHGHF